jgi:hypothetical protein
MILETWFFVETFPPDRGFYFHHEQSFQDLLHFLLLSDWARAMEGEMGSAVPGRECDVARDAQGSGGARWPAAGMVDGEDGGDELVFDWGIRGRQTPFTYRAWSAGNNS